MQMADHDDLHVSTTYLWANEMVLTFGQDGQQIPTLQGPYSRDLAAQIRTHATPETQWFGWGEEGPLDWHEQVPARFLPCPFDTDGDGDCSPRLRPRCPYCGRWRL